MNGSYLCDNEAASHGFVVGLVEQIITNEVLPEAKKTATNGRSDGLPITEDDDPGWLEEIVRDALVNMNLSKSEVAVVKTGTCIRRPFEIFSRYSALANPCWARQAASLFLEYDCCTADRVLISLQLTAEVWIELFRRDLFQFRDIEKKERFARAIGKLTARRRRLIGNVLPPVAATSETKE